MSDDQNTDPTIASTTPTTPNPAPAANSLGGTSPPPPPPGRPFDSTAVWLAYITTFGFFLLIAALIVLDRIPTTANTASPYKDILLTLMGIVGTAWAGIISFYFGSSVGSRSQSDTLQQISRNATVSRPGSP